MLSENKFNGKFKYLKLIDIAMKVTKRTSSAGDGESVKEKVK